MKKEDPLLTFPLDRLASYSIYAGTMMISYVVVQSYAEAASTFKEEITEPTTTGKRRKKERNIIKIGRKALNDTWNEIKAHPVIAAATAAGGAVGLGYWAFETGRHAYQYATGLRPVEDAEKAAVASAKELLRSIMKNHLIVTIGAMLITAGWSLWMSLHPEVVSSIVTALGSMGEVAIDEISEVIEAYMSWVPDDLEVSVI